MTAHRCVQLVVPGEAEYLDVVRTVVARQARRLDFSFDAIEDLCVAVDEACALLLTRSGPVDILELEVEEVVAGDVTRLDVLAGTRAPLAEWDGSALEEEMGWQLLHALAEEVHLVQRREGPAILIRQRRR